MNLVDKLVLTVVVFCLSLFGLRGLLPMISSYSIFVFCLAAVLIVVTHHLITKRQEADDLDTITQTLKFGEITVQNDFLQKDQVEGNLKIQNKLDS